jgi:hypothetical protein
MTGIVDVLALLTAQHDQIEELLVRVADPATRAPAFTELADVLPAHLALEQEVFYPAVAPLFGRDLMDEVLAEHCEIKRVLADLLWLDDDDARFGRKLAALATLLDGHSGWQEDRMFSAVAELVEIETRLALGARMQQTLELEPLAA